MGHSVAAAVDHVGKEEGLVLAGGAVVDELGALWVAHVVVARMYDEEWRFDGGGRGPDSVCRCERLGGDAGAKFPRVDSGTVVELVVLLKQGVVVVGGLVAQGDLGRIVRELGDERQEKGVLCLLLELLEGERGAEEAGAARRDVGRVEGLGQCRDDQPAVATAQKKGRELGIFLAHRVVDEPGIAFDVGERLEVRHTCPRVDAGHAFRSFDGETTTI